MRPFGRQSKFALPTHLAAHAGSDHLKSEPAALGRGCGGPQVFAQVISKPAGLISQQRCNAAAFDRQAPYLAALVASSCSANASVCATGALPGGGDPRSRCARLRHLIGRQLFMHQRVQIRNLPARMRKQAVDLR